MDVPFYFAGVWWKSWICDDEKHLVGLPAVLSNEIWTQDILGDDASFQ